MAEEVREKIFLMKHKKEITDLHRVMWVYTGIFLVWGLYRLVLRLPVWFEETVLKMMVFGWPVFWVVLHREKKRLEDLGMTTKGLLIAIYLGVFLGGGMGVLGRLAMFIRTGGIRFNPDATSAEFGNLLLLGLATAFWEELVFMGYMLPRVVKDLKNEWAGVIMVAVMFALLHVPILLVEKTDPGQILVRFFLLMSLAVANGILYLRFKNLAAPVFAHVLWGSVIYLFG